MSAPGDSFDADCPYWICNCKLLKASKILLFIAAVVTTSALVWIYGATVLYIAFNSAYSIGKLIVDAVIAALKFLTITIFVFPRANKCSGTDLYPSNAIPSSSMLKAEQPGNFDEVQSTTHPDLEAISAIYKSIEGEIDIIKIDIQNLKMFLNDIHNRLDMVVSEMRSNYIGIIQRLDLVEMKIESLSSGMNTMSDKIVNLMQNIFDIEAELKVIEKSYGKMMGSTVCKNYENVEYEKEIMYSCSSGECPVGAEALVVRRKRVVSKCID